MVHNPAVIVDSVNLKPGATRQIVIRIVGLINVQSPQIGSNGRFTFDPQVIRVRAIEGIDGFQVFARDIDNIGRQALFLAGYPGGSKGENGIVQIDVEAVGKAGEVSVLAISAIDVLADSHGNDITNYKLFEGGAAVEGRP